jgi:RNA polymerase sigma factor (sigma-70 family)
MQRKKRRLRLKYRCKICNRNEGLRTFSGIFSHAEAHMNVHISYKAGKTPDVEREFQLQLRKLERRLQVFKPDLVHFHAILEHKNGHSFGVSLNLRLPSGQMAAQNSGANVQAALKASFSDLLAQINKHKELLRGQWNWKSRRGSGRRQIVSPAVPFEQTLASVQPDIGTAAQQPQGASGNGDVSNWVNANLERLENFVDRELRYRVASGQLREGQVSREEVIDEVMVSALSQDEEKPDELSLESWFYRLALQAIRRLTQANADTGNVSLDAPARVQNVTGSDENLLQYHQPDDSLQEEAIIRDENVRTPEEIVASEEMVAQLDFVLHEVKAEDREAFVLYALEGFTVEEIARITDRSADRIRRSIQSARDSIQQKLPAQNELRRTLLRHSRVA